MSKSCWTYIVHCVLQNKVPLESAFYVSDTQKFLSYKSLLSLFLLIQGTVPYYSRYKMFNTFLIEIQFVYALRNYLGKGVKVFLNGSSLNRCHLYH